MVPAFGTGRVFLFSAVIPKMTAPRESCRKLGFKKVSQRISALSDEPPLSCVYTGRKPAACDLFLTASECERRHVAVRAGCDTIHEVSDLEVGSRLFRPSGEGRFVFSGQPEVDCTSWSVSQHASCYSYFCFVKVIYRLIRPSGRRPPRGWRAAEASSPRGLCRTIFILRYVSRFCQGSILREKRGIVSGDE